MTTVCLIIKQFMCAILQQNIIAHTICAEILYGCRLDLHKYTGLFFRFL